MRGKTAFRRACSPKTGSAVIEFTLLIPWLLFLFIFVIDLGFYNYSLISVENAARVAAEYTSSSSTNVADSSGACTKVLAELAALPNIGSTSSCSSYPVIVSASSTTGPDGGAATSVTVTYQGLHMIPIPGLLMGQLTFQRTVEMLVNE